MSYVLNTDADRKAMLEKIGVPAISDLFSTIPAEFQLQRPLAVPPAFSEMELEQHMAELAGKNLSADRAVCFLGGGSYDHFIPAVVDAVASRSEFYTAYTPYQAEASQGSLQAFFEYQTLICQLTGLDVSNASLYEGGSAVAESVLMSISIDPDRPKVLIAESVHPEYRQTLSTYLANIDKEIITLPTPHGTLDPAELQKHLDDKTLCVIVQHPNFFGPISKRVETIGKLCKEKGSALFVVSFDPISLGFAQTAGSIRGGLLPVGEGQSPGNADGVRRTLFGFDGVQGTILEEDSGPAGRANRRSQQQALLGLDAANARAAHPPRKGDEQHLHQSRVIRAAGGGLFGRARAARLARDGESVLAKGPLSRG